MPAELNLDLTLEEQAFNTSPAPAPVASTLSQPFGLHSETMYILECSVEMGDITPLEDLVLRTRNPAGQALMELMDRGESLPAHWLRNTARQYLASLPLEHRYVWALRCMPGMEFGMRMFQERVEFVVQRKVQSDLGLDKRTQLVFVDEATEDMFATALFDTVHAVTQANVEAFVASQYSEARRRLEEDLQLAHQAVEWIGQPSNRAVARQIAENLFEAVPYIQPDPGMQIAPPEHTRSGKTERRKTQRRARSAIKKALKLFSRTGLEDSVRLMVSGHDVELSHEDSPFKFVLQPLQAGWLEQKTVAPGGHVPFQLTLLTKEGVFLTRLCVLFDKTPVLDQLLALTFFVQSGNELDILDKANWFGYEDATAVRAILAERAPELLCKVPAPRVPGTTLGSLFFDEGHARQERNNSLWEPFHGPVRNWIAAWMGELLTNLPNPGHARLVAA